MQDTNEEAPEDKFEISLRLLGNEIFAMSLLSSSKKRNWMVFGLITLILVSILVERLIPVLDKISNIM